MWFDDQKNGNSCIVGRDLENSMDANAVQNILNSASGKPIQLRREPFGIKTEENYNAKN
jgi:hypothetical protein